MENFLDRQVKDKPAVIISALGLSVEADFIPFSRSRNSDEKSPSLNWKVTLKKGDKKILSTEYSAGCAHAPSYNQRDFAYADGYNKVKKECETGKSLKTGKSILPDTKDVIYSLLVDSEVLDYSSFEEWAGTFGYSEDSRQAERIYNACMKIALQFRAIGEDSINQLRDAFQDY